MRNDFMGTDELAELMRVNSNSIRARLCREGHYFGVKPKKLPNRFLAWPRADVARLLAGTK